MSYIKERIKAVVIDRTSDSNVFNSLGLNLLYEVVISLDIELQYGEDYLTTNGLECDWWWKFNHDGLPFILSGGLFSSHIFISLDTDQYKLKLK